MFLALDIGIDTGWVRYFRAIRSSSTNEVQVEQPSFPSRPAASTELSENSAENAEPTVSYSPYANPRHPNQMYWGDSHVHTRLSFDADVMATLHGELPEILFSEKYARPSWEKAISAAEKFNKPGSFTALIGYEWTPSIGGDNLHRNIIYRDGADKAKKMLPFTVRQSPNPEALWRWMSTYEDITGGEVIAIPHNGNLSNGTMFPVDADPATGRPFTRHYLAARAKWEPLYEVTQIKGDGETHPLLSTTDEFVDFETWDHGNLGLIPKQDGMIEFEYAREALKNGLNFQHHHDHNPYKFGMVGSTDTHTGLSTAEEENFFGKNPLVEPSEKRIRHPLGVASHGHPEHLNYSIQSASGYTGVWAVENTREAIFDAMKRREVYATSGPRIELLFFGVGRFLKLIWAAAISQKLDMIEVCRWGRICRRQKRIQHLHF